MKICVFGNINSGKSHIVKKLSLLFPDYKIIKIDEFRKQYSDGTKNGEVYAQEIFIKNIAQSSQAIIEFTGYGSIAFALFRTISDNSLVILNIKAELSLCLERIKEKDFSQTPYPESTDTIEGVIIQLSKILDEEDFINTFWHVKARQIFDISSFTNLNELNLQAFTT